jgi:hypothetical protein
MKIGVLVAAGVLLLFAILWICRFVYLQRFLVFTDGQVSLNYDQDLQRDRHKPEPLDPADFPITFADPEEGTAVSGPVDDSPKQLSGYYVTTNMLRDIPAVRDALDALEERPRTVLFELKSIFGNFYYDSDLFGHYTANADIEAVEGLIAELKQENVYLIAKIPAFSDNNFALDNQSCGLALSFGALWMDDAGCYWLDPMDEQVLNFLSAVAAELQELGFDEILFDGYLIPDSSRIVYDKEFTREEYAAQSAQLLTEALSGLPVRVSFGSNSPLMVGIGTRVYLSGVEGSAVSATAAPLAEKLEDPAAQVVFLTPSRDTRFEDYSVLRPLVDTEE